MSEHHLFSFEPNEPAYGQAQERGYLDEIIHAACGPNPDCQQSGKDFEACARRQSGKSARLDLLIESLRKDCIDEEASRTREVDQIADRCKSFAQAVALFAPGVSGWLASSAVGALNCARPEDKLEKQCVDLGLGALNGITARAAASVVLRTEANPAMQGVMLGATTRFIDASLRSEPYFDLKEGMRRALSWDEIQCDALVGLFANRIIDGSKLPLDNHPVWRSSFVGGVFGATSGATQEVMRQRQSGHPLNLYSITNEAVYDGLSGGAAGALGGFYFRNSTARPSSGTSLSDIYPRVVVSPPGVPPSGLPPGSSDFAAPRFIKAAGQDWHPLLPCNNLPPDRAGGFLDFGLANRAWRSGSLRGDLLSSCFQVGGASYQKHVDSLLCAFEGRAAAGTFQPYMVEKSYAEIGKMLRKEASKDERQINLILAEQLLEQAANPRQVFQGQYGTCAVASLEFRMFSRNPFHPIRMVSEVRRTGAFRTADGTSILLHPGSLGVDIEALHPYGEQSRSLASQYFQTAASNVYWQRRQWGREAEEMYLPRGSLRYEMTPQTPVQEPSERIVDYSKQGPLIIHNKPGLVSFDLENISTQITRAVEPWFYVARTSKENAPLHAVLVERLQAKAYPLVTSVHTSNYPFSSEAERNAGRKGGWHAISIVSYDPYEKIAEIHNTWGTNRHANTLTLEELKQATMPPVVDTAAR
jgi:hypothetical protein